MLKSPPVEGMRGIAMPAEGPSSAFSSKDESEPGKGVITKGAFSLKDSLESPKTLNPDLLFLVFLEKKARKTTKKTRIFFVPTEPLPKGPFRTKKVRL